MRVAILLAVAVLRSLATPPPAASAPAPVGLWVSETRVDSFARGPLTMTAEGSLGRAEIAGRVVRFAVARDSISFALLDGSGSFRGRIERNTDEIRGFWIRPGVRTEPARTPGDGPGLFDQAFATPVHLVKVGAHRYRGMVAPLEPRFTLYLYVWSDSTGWRAAFRNPEFNLHGGAARFQMRIEGDSVHFGARIASPDTHQIHFAARWDRRRARIRLPWDELGSWITLKPCGAESVGFWPRAPRGRRWPYRAPVADDDGWSTARASSVGMDEETLGRFTQCLADTNPAGPRPPLVHSCLIERHGRLIYEEYFYGFDRDRPHDLRSAAKTYASVLVGAAMMEGVGIAPESTLFSVMTIPGLLANPDPRKNRITVGHLMTHTSGLACDDGDESSPGNEGTMQGSNLDDWWRYTLDLPMRFDPGAQYAYCSGGMNLVGGVLVSATGRWLPEYFDSTIARPLGFRSYHYNLMPNGEGYLGGGIHVRPRDLLKLGRVYLDGGVWRGRRIVDSSWVRRSTSPQVRGNDIVDGYAWHLNTLSYAGREFREYEANGNGGQLLIVLPELDLSIVFTAGNYQRGGIWSRFRTELVPQRIIAAIRDR